MNIHVRYKNMTIEEAMKSRHTVRKFTENPIEEEKVRLLEERLKKLNDENSLGFRLVLNDNKGLPPFVRAIVSKGVMNYIILGGQDREGLEKRTGYAGADILLFAQTLGLNSWWIGGTYSHKNAEKISGAEKVLGIIVLGYGMVQGKPHKSKSAEDVSSYDGIVPEWFKKGIEASLLAPTGLNRQDFFIYGNKDEVSMEGSTEVDLGIVRYFFEKAAGKENFRWI